MHKHIWICPWGFEHEVWCKHETDKVSFKQRIEHAKARIMEREKSGYKTTALEILEELEKEVV